MILLSIIGILALMAFSFFIGAVACMFGIYNKIKEQFGTERANVFLQAMREKSKI